MGAMNLYTLWVLALASNVASSCWRDLEYGTLLPRDSSYLVGSDVTLRCILNKNTMDVDSMNYKINSSMIIFRAANRRVNTSNIEIYNQTEARLLIKNGLAGDEPYYDCGIKVNDVVKMICPTYIYFGYPPGNITGFKCRSYNWQNLTCTWNKVENTIPVAVSLTYSIYPMFYPYLSCPLKTTKKTSCSWTLDTTSAYIQLTKNLYFSLTSSNSDLGNYTQRIVVDHYSIVVPNKPMVYVSEKQARQVFLRIDPPFGIKLNFFPPGLCYRIKYRSGYEDPKIQEANNVTNITLRGLYPNTWYHLDVQAKSCSADTETHPDLWSPSFEASFTTEADIPEYPPEALNTFFDTINSETSRSATVYWKHVDSRNKNGDGFKYKVTLEETYLHRKRRSVVNSTELSGNHIQYQNLKLKTAYLVRIWAVNDEGPSNKYTTIAIPKAAEMPSRPQHVRPISDKGTYEVSWVKPAKSVGNYTFIWCQGEPRCTKSLQWMEVPAENDTVVLNLPDGMYDFAVATADENGALGSGLEWAPCTVYRTRVYRVRQIKLDDITSHSMKVSWKLDCEAQKAVATHYLVYQCECGKKSCMGNVSRKISDPQAESTVVDNLSPFTKYGFSVVAVSMGGQSMESEVKCETTLQAAPSDPPHDVKYSDVTNTTAVVNWKSPNAPNGWINNYEIYAKPVSGQYSSSGIKQFSYTITSNESQPFQFTMTTLKCFTNYSVTVKACVENACSPSSTQVYIKTEIGVPGPMEPPQTTNINSSHVRVFWKAPVDANGPLDHYLLHQFKKEEGGNLTRLDLVNVTGTSVDLSSGCMPHVQTEGGWTHVFSVQAVNLVPGVEEILFGPISNTTETNVCFVGTNVNSTFVIGVIVGSTLALAVVIMFLYSMARWMKNKVDKMKDVIVDLPKGLQQPHSNSYENFKNGLGRQSSDPNLSPKLGYNRGMEPFNDNNDNNNADDSFKNRHGSGASHISASSTDELICKQSQGGQVTAPRSMGLGGQKTTQKGERNPSGDSSSGHDSISSSLTHRTNLSTDGSTSGQDTKGRDAASSRDSGLDEESKSLGGTTKPLPASPNNKCPYLPATAYSKLGLMGPRSGDYFPFARGRHLSLYGQNLANSEPSITDLNQEPYVLDHVPQHVMDPPSPDVPYSKFGMSHSVTDLMLEGMELPDSPLSSQPSPQEALPYSRFGLRRNPAPSQKTPYVTMGMALLMGAPKDPNQLLSSKNGPTTPLVLKSPSKKKQPPEVSPMEVSTISDEAYSKLGLGSVVEQQKVQPYLTMKEVRENEQNRFLPDLTVSSREESPTDPEPDVRSPPEDTSKSGYLPHQFIPTVAKAPEPALPDLVNCSSISSLAAVLQEMPEVKVQGNNGYVSLNQVLANNTSV